ncbi:MAG: ADYC domain-containing protein, partial [Microcystaceae cyanobacterium]
MKKTSLLWIGSGVVSLVAGAVYFIDEHLRPFDPKTHLTVPPSVVLKGKAVEGAVLTSTDSQGKSLALKIQDVSPDPKDLEGEVYLYTVVYQNTPTSQWQNLCQLDQDSVAKAIP